MMTGNMNEYEIHLKYERARRKLTQSCVQQYADASTHL